MLNTKKHQLSSQNFNLSSQKISSLPQDSIHPAQEKILKEVLKLSFPTWPLQNTVAVQPFWFLRQQPFERVMEKISALTGLSLLPRLMYYQEQMKKGMISDPSLAQALEEARSLWPELPSEVEQLKNWVSNTREDHSPQKFPTFADFYDQNASASSFTIAEVGKYAAAYLDQHQSMVKLPSREERFFRTWIQAQHLDRALEAWGITRKKNDLKSLKDLHAEEAIFFMLQEMGIFDEQVQKTYLEALLISVLGWSSTFTYLHWQKDLGYSEAPVSNTRDLLAVRLAYDWLLYKHALDLDLKTPSSWKHWISQSTQKLSTQQDSRPDPSVLEESHPVSLLALKFVLQLASELTNQRDLATALAEQREKNRSSLPQTTPPQVQMIFCIDVRSEMLRRHIEAVHPSVDTFGFAGFFGLRIDYARLDETQAHHRFPVLLPPSMKIHETTPPHTSHTPASLLNQALSQSYFKALRKGSLSSFPYIEFFGAFYIDKIISQSLSSLRKNAETSSQSQRFHQTLLKPDLSQIYSAQGEKIETQALIDPLASILKHMGLTSHFADWVMIVGHGSATQNNAFGSSLECGACGGHAGDINARIIANLLNEPAIRFGLKQKSIEIPETTRFVATLHETVTDELMILDPHEIPAHLHQNLHQLQETLKKASLQCQNERQTARSALPSPSPQSRSQSWSEVRPEWGLAGNSSFLIAPRQRSRGVNLKSRTFLHHYEWMNDEKTGFQTLELIMTAPMIVTNWINLQYYASTVAPELYGSGNKVLHNLVNESGVVEGNGGDLRVGLPVQSIHDGSRWVHEPLRLSVWIEAPRAAIEGIIQKHELVRELLQNEWLHLIQIDPVSEQFFKRTRKGVYLPLDQQNN